MLYLFDSNTLIEANNRYYGVDIAPGFWEFILREAQKTRLKSIDFVLKEIKEGDDELKSWVTTHKAIFDISSEEEEIQKIFRKWPIM
jgi:hypothetical protein